MTGITTIIVYTFLCNIGNNNPVDLEYFIKTIEKKLQKNGREADFLKKKH